MKTTRVLGCFLLSGLMICAGSHKGMVQHAQASGLVDLITTVAENSEQMSPAETPVPPDLPVDRIECGGFDTPEEAITAFAQALQAGDLEEMISTFAIESYVEHFSLADQLQWTGSIMSPMIQGTYPITPSGNDLFAQMSVEGRAATVLSAIKSPLLCIAADRMAQSDDPVMQGAAAAVTDGIPYLDGIKDMTLTQLNEVIAAMQQIPDFSGMTISEPITMPAFSVLTDSYLKLNSLKTLFRQALAAGADGYTERGILLADDNTCCLITCSIIKYGDKWYNCMPGGAISMILGISTSRQGIICIDTQMINELFADTPLGAAGLSGPSALPDLLSQAKAAGAGALLTIITENAAEFNQSHEAFVTQLQSGRDEDGNLLDVSGLDFSSPLINQTGNLKKAADDSGLAFYSSSLNTPFIMSFEEMLDYFALR